MKKIVAIVIGLSSPFANAVPFAPISYVDNKCSQVLTSANAYTDLKNYGDVNTNDVKSLISTSTNFVRTTELSQWAKEPYKPTYTASEVGARPNDWMPNLDQLCAQTNLVSGVNIKTINGESVLGSGNIDVQGGATDTNIVNAIIADYDSTNITPRIDAKANSNELASVAWSGDYGDLTGTPAIPEVPSGIVTTNETGQYMGDFVIGIQGGHPEHGYEIKLYGGQDYPSARSMYVDDVGRLSLPYSVFREGINLGSEPMDGSITLSSGSIILNAGDVAVPNWQNIRLMTGERQTLPQYLAENYMPLTTLAAVATSGSYGDLSDTPTIPTDEGITNAAAAVFAECADYILTNLTENTETFSLASGHIGNLSLDSSHTNINFTLVYPDNNNRSADIFLRVICAADCELAIGSANTDVDGSDWTKVSAGTNYISATRTAYDEGRSKVLVNVKGL